MYVKFSEKAHCCEIRDIVKHHHGTNKEAKTSHHNTYQYDPLFRSKFAKLMENKCLAMFVQIKKKFAETMHERINRNRNRRAL